MSASPVRNRVSVQGCRALLVVGLVAWATTAEAQVGFLEEEFVQAGILRKHGEFGRSADVSGNLAIFGSAEAYNRGSRKGRAGIYRFRTDHWAFEQEVHPNTPPPHGHFGVSAAIDGDAAAVGAQGRMYVFERSGLGWSQVFQQVGSVLEYGQVLDLRGSSLLMRSGRSQVNTYEAGPWRLTSTLVGPSGSSFGESIDFSGEDLAVIGAPFDDGNQSGSGAAYIYRRNGPDWALEQKVSGSDSLNGDQFGQAVSIHGNLLVVGAMMHDRSGNSDAGAIYTFWFDGANWVQDKKLGRGSPWLGTDVATNGEHIFAAARSYGYYDVHTWRREAGKYSYEGLAASAVLHRNYPVDKYLEVDGGTLVMGESLRNVDGIKAGRARVRTFLELTVPDAASAGSIVTPIIRGADPGTPFLLAITSIQGVPVFREVDRGRFNEDRTARTTLPIPPNMMTDLELTAWALPEGGSPVASDVELLTVR